MNIDTMWNIKVVKYHDCPHFMPNTCKKVIHFVLISLAFELSMNFLIQRRISVCIRNYHIHISTEIVRCVFILKNYFFRSGIFSLGVILE